MGWDEERLQATMVRKHRQFISVVFSDSGQCSWILTIIYTSTSILQRRNLWNLLASCEFDNRLWIICGDMNVITDPKDKVGGKPFAYSLL